MSKSLLALIGIAGAGILLAVILIVMAISFHNKEVDLRTQITNKQIDNKSEMDAMWKIIDQNAQVTVIQKEALMDIFGAYAQGRTPKGGSGALALWVKEAVPTVDQKTYTLLMNTITAQREGFKFRQKELLDQGREHDRLIQRFPGVVFATILGKKHIDLVIVTSTRTEEAFKTGKDDNVDLPGVKKNQTPAEKQQ